MIDRLTRLFGRAMYVLYVVAAVVIARPDLAAPAAWLLGAVAVAVILRLTARELTGILQTAREALAAWKGMKGDE